MMAEFFESLINNVLTDPTFVMVGLVLVVLITLAIFKKLFKVVFLLIAALVGYAGYLIYTGADPTEAVEGALKKSREVLEEVKDTDLKDLKEGAERVIDDTKKKVEKKIK
jgi:xanthine/uracil permease